MAEAPNLVVDVLNQILARLVSIEQRVAAIDARQSVIEKRVQLTQQYALLCAIQTGGLLDMTIKIDDLVARITPLTGVIDGAVALLTDLHTHLHEAIQENDPVKMQAVADAMDAGKAKLADALVANTDAAPAPAPAPAPTDPNAPTT